jgi:hypothetical protein
MVELSFGELKQGLICCTVYRNCSGCPLYMGPEKGPHDDCTYQLMSAAFNCINTMEKDLADAVKSADMWKEQAENLQEVLSEKF